MIAAAKIVLINAATNAARSTAGEGGETSAIVFVCLILGVLLACAALLVAESKRVRATQ